MTEGSARRISTAAHCPNVLHRLGVNIPFNDAQNGGSHDEQIHTSGGTVISNRAADNSTDAATHGYRNITSKTTRANQALNSFYCRYGLGTSPAYGCGNLISKTLLGGMPNPAATSMRLHSATTDLSSPGDSGGPVYNGASALGMIHGCISVDLQCDNPALDDDLVYIAINYVESGVDATLLTVP